MVKAVSPFAIGCITHLINQSLTSGKFPKAWKKSVIHPLPKTSNPTTPQQLRPISRAKIILLASITTIESAKTFKNLDRF